MCTLFYTLESCVCRKNSFQLQVIRLDVAISIILCIGLIFCVQPTELFGGFEYFNRYKNSVCSTSSFGAHQLAEIGYTPNSTFCVLDIHEPQNWKGYLFAYLCGMCIVTYVSIFKKRLRQTTAGNKSLLLAMICGCLYLPEIACIRRFASAYDFLCFLGLGTVICYHIAYIGFFYFGACDNPTLDVAILSGLTFFLRFGKPKLFILSPTNDVTISAVILVFVVVLGKPILQWFLARKGYLK